MFTYLLWHYTGGLRLVFANAVNRTIGFLNYFSVAHLLRTLFTPWHRIIESYGRGFDPSRFLFTLAGNLIARVLGAIVRLFTIAFGLAATAVAAVFGGAAVLFWLLSPLLVVAAVLAGLILIA